jgi:uncharacterized Fe-S center protein
MSAPPFQLVHQGLGVLPILDAVIVRIGLEGKLTEALGNTRYAHAVLLLVKNIVVERNALYAVAEWAAPYDPALVYGGKFSDDVLARALDRLFQTDRASLLTGAVLQAIKAYGVEPHGPNIVPREMVIALQHIPNSCLVETNTFYKGQRNTMAEHRVTLKINGWDFCPVDIMDEDGAVMIPVEGGKHFKEMSVGEHMLNYDSMVVLTHFKGHLMGGFGGSLKNIAIGCADGLIGKKMVHAAPDNEDISKWLTGEPFMENMVESAKATTDHFGNRIVYINVLRNMSVDCDCLGVSAVPPKAHDLGILASIDILAVDQASIDMVYQLPEAELHDLKERIESRQALRQLSYMKEMKMGKRDYELVTV